MKPPYRLYGAELSPYSVKVRSYLRWKDIPHQWIIRNAARQAEFARYAKLPLMPLLVCADDAAFQDSTPIIEKLEATHPAPAMTPDDEALAFLAALIEDYSDEWVNKAMFHYRWRYEPDQASAAARLADMIANDEMDRPMIEATIRERMISRLHFVGSSDETAPIIEDSYVRLVDLLEAHLGGVRDYLFGARPSLADFGLAGQLYELLCDPTPGALMRARGPCVVAWVERMDHPRGRGDFEPLDALMATLAPILAEIGRVYPPWMEANANAVESGAPSMTAEIDGKLFTQAPQKYAARAWAEIKKKRAASADGRVAKILEEARCVI